MKYCTHCGKELNDNDKFCPYCGSQTESEESLKSTSSKKSQSETLREVAFIFMVIITIFTGFAIIPLAWMLPMTIYLNNRIKAKEPINLAYKVCVLIFCSIIPGIILLVEDIDK